jgi:hypothetical protein
MRSRLLGAVCTCIIITSADVANAVTIDFNNFTLNTELDVV